MQKLLPDLRAQYPQLRFSPGEQFCWSPQTSEIIYKKNGRGKRAAWSLLHETAHALLGHHDYRADYELLRLEAAAWAKAEQLATEFKISIDQDHIQDCLDTYRDWLYRRSLCPSCNSQCLQQDDLAHYRCHNCHTTWRVSANRFGRAYRATEQHPDTAPIFI